MKPSVIPAATAAKLAVKTLGLDEQSVGLFSAEALCASLRRAASFLCPATPRQIVDAVLEASRPLGANDAPTRDEAMEDLDLLIASGDLLELRQETGQSTRLLFLGPPSYVEREPGKYLLLGIRPFGGSLVGSELAQQVQYEGHTRTIEVAAQVARMRFAALGLHEISPDRWTAQPRRLAAAILVEQLRDRLAAARPSGEIEDLLVLDPSTSVRYYRGRWRAPTRTDSGDFVARRPQAYGADLWCFVRLSDGAPQRLVDFPLDNPAAPARDEAWRLQAAIDATRGHPQRYRAREVGGPDSDRIVDVFSPLPGWAERHLELAGLAIQRAAGSLFSYRVAVAALPGVVELLADMLWMQAAPEGGTE